MCHYLEFWRKNRFTSQIYLSGRFLVDERLKMRASHNRFFFRRLFWIAFITYINKELSIFPTFTLYIILKYLIKLPFTQQSRFYSHLALIECMYTLNELWCLPNMNINMNSHTLEILKIGKTTAICYNIKQGTSQLEVVQMGGTNCFLFQDHIVEAFAIVEKNSPFHLSFM